MHTAHSKFGVFNYFQNLHYSAHLKLKRYRNVHYLIHRIPSCLCKVQNGLWRIFGCWDIRNTIFGRKKQIIQRGRGFKGLRSLLGCNFFQKRSIILVFLYCRRNVWFFKMPKFQNPIRYPGLVHRFEFLERIRIESE